MMIGKGKKMQYFAQVNLGQLFAVIFLQLIIICLPKEAIVPERKQVVSKDKVRIMKYREKKVSILKN